MRKPVCIATGDVHFTLRTLELATSAVRQALRLAKELDVPLVLNGDTLDSKSIIRAEIANRLIEILEPEDSTKVYINRGNHDQLHERVAEHALNFLSPYAQVVSNPTYVESLKSYIVPYFSDNHKLQAFLDTVPKGSRLICHQGILGADMGHYLKDSSSLSTDAFADFRTILSHFHKRQDLKCGRPRKGAVGLASYLGSPYSISFSEANDGEKGINVLYDDGTLELVPTNLRKHVVIDISLADWIEQGQPSAAGINPGDLVWLKLRGPASELAKVRKADIAKALGVDNFKFDKIPTETERLDEDEKQEARTGEQLLDALIDKSDEAAGQKSHLKSLWRELVA